MSTDVMAYCPDQWISDYQYRSIFERISYVNTRGFRLEAEELEYAVGLVAADGEVTWVREATLSRAPSSPPVRVLSYDAGDGAVDSLAGHFYPYDHLPGGIVYVPRAAVRAIAPRAVKVRVLLAD